MSSQIFNYILRIFRLLILQTLLLVPIYAIASDNNQIDSANSDITKEISLYNNSNLTEYENYLKNNCDKSQSKCDELIHYYNTLGSIGYDNILYKNKAIEIKIKQLKKCEVNILVDNCLYISDSIHSYEFNSPYAISLGIRETITKIEDLKLNECKKGNDDICMDTALTLILNPKDYDSSFRKVDNAYKAAEMYEIACKRMNYKACFYYAGLFKGEFLPLNYDLNKSYFNLGKKYKIAFIHKNEPECLNNNYKICTQVADALLSSDSEEESYRAINMYEISCDNFYADACSKLKDLYLRGNKELSSPIKQNTNMAMYYYNKSCLENNNKLKDDDIITDITLSLYSIGCYEGIFDAYLTGQIDDINIGKDLKKAEDILKNKICDKNDIDKCYQLGIYYLNLSGTYEEKAILILGNSCNDNNDDACLILAALNENKFKSEPSQYIELYKKSCAHKNRIACLKYAYFLEQGVGVDKNPIKAYNLYQALCLDLGYELGISDIACFKIGQMIESGDFVPSDNLRAKKIFDVLEYSRLKFLDPITVTSNAVNFKSSFSIDLENPIIYEYEKCKDKVSYSCYILYKIAMEEQISNDDDTPLFNINLILKGLDNDCSSDIYEACNTLGDIYKTENTPFTNYIKSIIYYKKGCENNIIHSCAILGYIYTDGNYITQNYTEALKYLEMTCDKNIDFSCTTLGIYYENGYGVAIDISKALDYYKKSCYSDTNLRQACTMIGDMYADGKLGTKNINTSLKYYRLGCEQSLLQNADACYKIAQYYSEQKSLKDRFKASKFYEDSCDNDSQLEIISCDLAAVSYLKGKNGFPYDIDKAITLYKKACEKGNGISCNTIGVLYGNGEEIDQDYGMARYYFNKACDLNLKTACENLEMSNE